MALPFQTSLSKKRSLAVAIDLGLHTTKGVCIQRRGDGFDLLGYTVQEAPPADKQLSADALAAHLKSVVQSLGSKTKQITLLIGVDHSLLRHAEVLMVPVADLRLMLKYSSKNYLHQDLPDYVFDCHVLPPRAGSNAPEPQRTQKCSVLVGGAKKQFLDLLQEAARGAGLVTDQVTPGLIGTANAFEMALPEAFAKEIVALVDIGFKHSTISILMNGELRLNRVVAIGGDKLTSGLAEAMGANYAEAEKAKLAMSDEIQAFMLGLLTPLGRELRASIEIVKPETVAEKLTLTLKARDYSKGNRVDPFYAAVTNAPFFRLFLSKTNSSVQPDTIQPREDESDKINGAEAFIPFTVQANLPERVRSNE